MSRNPRTKAGHSAAKYDPYWLKTILAIEDEAAATERRLTVERVKRAIRLVTDNEPYDLGYVKECARLANDVARAILDDLATADVDEEAGDG